MKIGILQQVSLVISCEEVASRTFLLRFKSKQIAEQIKPGQFVNVLPSEIGKEPLLRRPFSVSRIDGDIIALLFHAIGTGTILLSQKRAGDEIDIIGPLGQSFHVEADYDTAFIVAGGIGVAPFPLLTSSLFKLGKHIETFVGFRSANQIYKSNLQNIHIATDDGSEGLHGTVIQLIEPYLSRKEFGKIKMFGCGPTPMLKALTEIAKINSICCEVSLEGQMACGIGICQGCPVERVGDSLEYALVCKDGPTFLTTEVKL